MSAQEFRYLPEPPRRLPFSLVMRQLIGTGGIQVSWFLLGFILIFAWAFVLNDDLKNWLRFRKPLEYATATVTAFEKIGRGGDENYFGPPLCRVQYVFDAADGKEYTVEQRAIGYFEIGRPRDPEYLLGRREIEYVRDNPRVSRIKGTLQGRVLWAPLLTCLFFGGLALLGILFGPLNGVSLLRLLRSGKLVVAKLVAVEPIQPTFRQPGPYQLTYRYAADDGQTYTYTMAARKNPLEIDDENHSSEATNSAEIQPSSRPPNAVDAPSSPRTPARIEDQPPLQLIYHPAKPARAVRLDQLREFPPLTAAGNFEAPPLYKAPLWLILPGLVLGGHGWYAYHFFPKFFA